MCPCWLADERASIRRHTGDPHEATSDIERELQTTKSAQFSALDPFSAFINLLCLLSITINRRIKPRRVFTIGCFTSPRIICLGAMRMFNKLHRIRFPNPDFTCGSRWNSSFAASVNTRTVYKLQSPASEESAAARFKGFNQ